MTHHGKAMMNKLLWHMTRTSMGEASTLFCRKLMVEHEAKEQEVTQRKEVGAQLS
jgi:hypothetical protein